MCFAPAVSSITTEPNDVMLPVHDRMPVIVPADQYDVWLSGEPDDAMALVKAYSADAMASWAVRKRVNRAGEEGKSLIEPAG